MYKRKGEGKKRKEKKRGEKKREFRRDDLVINTRISLGDVLFNVTIHSAKRMT